MLDSLDEFDWSKVSHAYGPANDVPRQIRRLASDDHQEREDAYVELCGSINHQGSLYSATPVAVPFLTELLSESATREKNLILDLLQGIAEDAAECLGHFVDGASPSPSHDGQATPAEVRATYDAVDRGRDVYCRLLVDPDADVRISAAFVLGRLESGRAEIAPLLAQLIDAETDDHCRAAGVLALMMVVEHVPDHALARWAVRRFEEVLKEPQSSGTSTAACIALLRLRRKEAIPRIFERAWPALTRDQEFFRRLPWMDQDDPFSSIAINLEFVPEARFEWIKRGLGHPDSEIQALALYAGTHFCADIRWAPSSLAPDFLRLAASSDKEVRQAAMRGLSEMGDLGAECLGALHRHPVKQVRQYAKKSRLNARMLRQRSTWLGPRPPFFRLRISTLLNAIRQHKGSRRFDDRQKVQEALVGIGQHGAAALPVVDEISSLADDYDPWIRVHAIRALWKITKDPDRIVPLLLANIEPWPYAFLVLDQLKKIGPAARQAVPRLRQIIDSDRRFSHECALDNALVEAAREALSSIDTECATAK